MDVLKAIKNRRSCRNFLAEPISSDLIEKILESATWAPSAANNQPWEFIVITNKEIKDKIHFESMICKKKIYDRSGWKWVDKYQAGFIMEAPVIIAVVGDPEKIGAHKYLKGTEAIYQHGCAAAIQNMLLAAHALGLGSLWFTLFDRDIMKQTLGIEETKEPLAMICIGKAAGSPLQTPRKEIKQITRYIK
ncbi:MAG: 5,6-dimethylbenzimidazole synthase [Syntrophus sp. SKADARSKE-3]|nr:5,6-dimethylbenzimidazole synthase [Syntrophus sp. SKADARSKE-3]